jgi:hypothetical protein
MTAEGWNSLTRRVVHYNAMVSKHSPVATHKHTTMGLLDAVFSIWSTLQTPARSKES